MCCALFDCVILISFYIQVTLTQVCELCLFVLMPLNKVVPQSCLSFCNSGCIWLTGLILSITQSTRYIKCYLFQNIIWINTNNIIKISLITCIYNIGNQEWLYCDNTKWLSFTANCFGFLKKFLLMHNIFKNFYIIIT